MLNNPRIFEQSSGFDAFLRERPEKYEPMSCLGNPNMQVNVKLPEIMLENTLE